MFLLRHDASRARCPRPGWTDNLPAADFLIIHDGRCLSHSGAADTRLGFARALILIVPFAAKTVQMERQRSAYYGSYASGAFSIRSPSSSWLWGFAGCSVQYSRKKNEISVQNKQIGSLAQHHPSAIGNGIAAGADGRHRINFFAAGFIDTIHTWLQKKDRTPEQIAKFLLEMLVQLRS